MDSEKPVFGLKGGLKRGLSSHLEAKMGVFNGQLSQKYKLLEKVFSLTNVFEEKSCILLKVESDG